jgi:hypothetical protein
MEAAKIQLLSVDNSRSAIMVNVPVVIALFDDDGSVAFHVTVSVTLTNRYSDRANANPDLFRSSRHCAANSSYGGDHYGVLNHCVLLSLLNSGRAIPGRRDRSAIATEPGLRGAHRGLE